MADLKPIPYVQINGVDMATSFSQGDAVVLDGLTITWGRKRMFDTVGPASLNLRVLDKTGAWVQANEQMVGLTILTGIRFTDEFGTARDFKNFRGRIAEVEVVARDADTSTDNGYSVYIRANDKLAEVANTLIYANYLGSSWGTSMQFGRNADIYNSIRNSGVELAGIGGAYTSGQISWPDTRYDGDSALDVIAEHLAASVEWPNYDPDTNRIETTGRVAYEGGGATWTGLKLAETSTGSGKYALQSDASSFYLPFGAMGNNLDAGSLQATSGIQRSVESGITDIVYTYYPDYNNALNRTNKIVATVPTGLNKSIYGRRVFKIETNSFGGNGPTFADNYKKAAITAQSWQPPEVLWDTRINDHGFKSFVQVRSMISGRAWSDPLFLSRSRYNAFPKRVPIYFVIGGTMAYEANESGDMGWIVEPSFGTVEFPVQTWTPLAWNTINPSTTNIVGWDDLDDNVTWNDSSLTGQGV